MGKYMLLVSLEKKCHWWEAKIKYEWHKPLAVWGGRGRWWWMQWNPPLRIARCSNGRLLLSHHRVRAHFCRPGLVPVHWKAKLMQHDVSTPQVIICITQGRTSSPLGVVGYWRFGAHACAAYVSALSFSEPGGNRRNSLGTNGTSFLRNHPASVFDSLPRCVCAALPARYSSGSLPVCFCARWGSRPKRFSSFISRLFPPRPQQMMPLTP